jgi:hypothetical protein
MSTIVIYCDFDGTLTQRTGASTVFTAFYQSMFAGFIGVIQKDYLTPSFKSADEMQRKFEEKFGKYTMPYNYSAQDTEFLLSVNALEFLKSVIKYHEIHFFIVTKNRPEYIKAMLRYQGLTPYEISKINFKSSMNKYHDVRNDHTAGDYYFLFDDDQKDLEAMHNAVKEKIHESRINVFHTKKPGNFDWPKHLNDIQSILIIDKIKKTSEIALAKYLKYHQCNNKRDPQATKYNRLQGCGLFSFLRHGLKGQRVASEFNAKINALNNVSDLLKELHTFLSDPSRAFHHHSFTSYLADELSNIDLVKPKFGARYTQKELVAQIVDRQLQVTNSAFPSRKV